MMPHESHHLAEIAGNDDFFFESLSLSLFNPPPPPPAHPFHLKSSKYLLPARELLGEFCGLGGANWDGDACFKRIRRRPSMNDSNSVEANELLKRKVKLLSMLEEVDKRYRRYWEQMKALVSAFEDTAGEGAARTYSMLASKAMSRHFRCLRDGIDGQMRATRRALGESFADDDVAAPGLTRGETPRLRLLASQCARQSKAFHHVGMSIVAPEIGRSSHPWRPQRGLPERSVSILRAWLFENFLHPYPSDIDKHILAGQTRLSRSQVSNWFINARVRLWKPMIEEMYLKELKEEDKRIRYSTMHGALNTSNAYSNPNPNLNPSSFSIEKPHFCAREPIGDEGQFSIFEGETPAILTKTS